MHWFLPLWGIGNNTDIVDQQAVTYCQSNRQWVSVIFRQSFIARNYTLYRKILSRSSCFFFPFSYYIYCEHYAPRVLVCWKFSLHLTWLWHCQLHVFPSRFKLCFHHHYPVDVHQPVANFVRTKTLKSWPVKPKQQAETYQNTVELRETADSCINTTLLLNTFDV